LRVNFSRFRKGENIKFSKGLSYDNSMGQREEQFRSQLPCGSLGDMSSSRQKGGSNLKLRVGIIVAEDIYEQA